MNANGGRQNEKELGRGEAAAEQERGEGMGCENSKFEALNPKSETHPSPCGLRRAGKFELPKFQCSKQEDRREKAPLENTT